MYLDSSSNIHIIRKYLAPLNYKNNNDSVGPIFPYCPHSIGETAPPWMPLSKKLIFDSKIEKLVMICKALLYKPYLQNWWAKLHNQYVKLKLWFPAFTWHDKTKMENAYKTCPGFCGATTGLIILQYIPWRFSTRESSGINLLLLVPKSPAHSQF